MRPVCIYIILVCMLGSCRSRVHETHGDLVKVADCTIKDSLRLTYVSYACDCPHWMETAALDSFDHRSDTSHAIFDDRKYGYYVEPAGTDDPLDSLIHNYTRVILYGRIDTAMRYPKNAKFIDPDPPAGKVFIYCAYRVLMR